MRKAILSRPYDVALSKLALEYVVRRRESPDGEELKLRYEMRGNERVAFYPWKYMKLGDFFFVPLLGRSPGFLSVRFRHAAARRDMELTVVTVLRNGEKILRVCATMFGVKEAKKKAQQYHGATGLHHSDGRWLERRRIWAKQRKVTKRRPKQRVEILDDPDTQTHADRFKAMLDDPNVEKDVTLSPTYDRDAVMRERMKALGIEV